MTVVANWYDKFLNSMTFCNAIHGRDLAIFVPWWKAAKLSGFYFYVRNGRLDSSTILAWQFFPRSTSSDPSFTILCDSFSGIEYATVTLWRTHVTVYQQCHHFKCEIFATPVVFFEWVKWSFPLSLLTEILCMYFRGVFKIFIWTVIVTFGSMCFVCTLIMWTLCEMCVNIAEIFSGRGLYNVHVTNDLAINVNDIEKIDKFYFLLAVLKYFWLLIFLHQFSTWCLSTGFFQSEDRQAIWWLVVRSISIYNIENENGIW